MSLDTVYEVFESRNVMEVNDFLAHGYTLLSLNSFSATAKRDGNFYVKKGVVYTLGRSEDIDHYEIPSE